MKEYKPTVEEIVNDLVPKCEEIYGELFRRFEDDERYYELNFRSELNLPSQFASDGIILPTGRDTVDTFVDNIDINNARIYVNRKGTFNISVEEAEMMEKVYLGLLYMINIEADIGPVRVCGKHYAMHGLTGLKTVWAADKWPNKPIQKLDESEGDYADRIEEWQQQTQLELPIAWLPINPRCIMPDPAYGGRMFVIEKHTNMCFDILQRYPHWGNPKGRKIDQDVDFISFWTAKYRCDLVDGEPVLKVKTGVARHNYGFIPYVLIDSGFGNLSYEAKPEMRYVGILRYMFDLLKSESLNYSLCDILMKRETLKGGYVTGADAATLAEIKQEYGVYYPLGDKDVEFHDWGTKLAPQEAYAHLGLTRDYIEAHGAPSILRGLSASGVRSGADRRYAAGLAANRYSYSIPAFKHGIAKALINSARLIKNVIPGKIRLWARTPIHEFDIQVDRKLMREPFSCSIEFSPHAQEEEYRRQDGLERLYNSGLVSKRWARRQMPNVDVVSMELEEEKERIRSSPSYLQMKDQYAAGKLAEAIAKREGAEAMMAGEEPPIALGETPGVRGEMPGGMVTPIPQRAIPGSAEEMQNILQQQRSQISPTQQGMGGGGARGATR